MTSSTSYVECEIVEDYGTDVMIRLRAGNCTNKVLVEKQHVQQIPSALQQALKAYRDRVATMTPEQQEAELQAQLARLYEKEFATQNR